MVNVGIYIPVPWILWVSERKTMPILSFALLWISLGSFIVVFFLPLPSWTQLCESCVFSGLQYVPKSTLHFNSNTPFSNIDTPKHSYVYMFDKGKNTHFPKPKHHVRSKYVQFSVGVRVYIYIVYIYICIYMPRADTTVAQSGGSRPVGA